MNCNVSYDLHRLSNGHLQACFTYLVIVRKEGGIMYMKPFRPALPHKFLAYTHVTVRRYIPKHNRRASSDEGVTCITSSQDSVPIVVESLSVMGIWSL